MKTYKANISEGQGCDYTIACGETVIEVGASTMDEAREKIISIIREEYSHPERRLQYCELYEVSDIFSVDLKQLYESIDEAKGVTEQLQRDNEERAEFERLKNKFGGQ